MERTVSKFHKQGFTVNPALLQMSIGDIFGKLDTRGTGRLTKNDLRAGFLLSEAQLDDETLNALWLIADENNDNSVDMQEFEKIWKYLLRQGLARVKAEVAKLRTSMEGDAPLPSSPGSGMNDSLESSFGKASCDSPRDNLVVTKSALRNYETSLCKAGLAAKPELLRLSIDEVFTILDTGSPFAVLSKEELRGGFHVKNQPLDGAHLDALWALANDNLDGRVSPDSFERVWKLVVRDFEIRRREEKAAAKAERTAKKKAEIAARTTARRAAQQ